MSSSEKYRNFIPDLFIFLLSLNSSDAAGQMSHSHLNLHLMKISSLPTLSFLIQINFINTDWLSKALEAPTHSQPVLVSFIFVCTLSHFTVSEPVHVSDWSDAANPTSCWVDWDRSGEVTLDVLICAHSVPVAENRSRISLADINEVVQWSCIAPSSAAVRPLKLFFFFFLNHTCSTGFRIKGWSYHPHHHPRGV